MNVFDTELIPKSGNFSRSYQFQSNDSLEKAKFVKDNSKQSFYFIQIIFGKYNFLSLSM